MPDIFKIKVWSLDGAYENIHKDAPYHTDSKSSNRMQIGQYMTEIFRMKDWPVDGVSEIFQCSLSR